MNNGWDNSAKAWISLLGKKGDFSRAHVLDEPMLARVATAQAKSVLDVGCGEGRFCRMMAGFVPKVTGLDPTEELLAQAKKHGGATYTSGVAEAMPFENGSFDLVVSYLSLIDIQDMEAGLSEMTRVLRPGGRLLIANLNSWKTGSLTKSEYWQRDRDGAATLTIDHYLDEHSHWGEWAGLRIRNWHRPMAYYMQALLSLGMTLVHFDEPKAAGDYTAGSAAHAYNKAPWLMMMEWQKPNTDKKESARNG